MFFAKKRRDSWRKRDEDSVTDLYIEVSSGSHIIDENSFIPQDENQGEVDISKNYDESPTCLLKKDNFDEIFKVVEHKNLEILDNGICTICFEEFSSGKEYRIAPCKHLFHLECIYQWVIINGNNKCPKDSLGFTI